MQTSVPEGRKKSAPIERIKAFFEMEDAEPDGRGFYHACCPAHDDKEPSLSYWETPTGGVGFHCFAGCPTESILTAIGLADKDIRANGYKPGLRVDRTPVSLIEISIDKLIPWQALFNFGVTDGYKYRGQELLRIAYRTRDGQEHTKIRVRTGKSGHDSMWIKETPGEIIPYGLWKLDEAEQAGYVVIGEGESDAWTCWYHGVPFLGIPGATLTRCLDVGELAKVPRIYILQEPDQADKARSLDKAAQGFYASVYSQLRAGKYQGQIFYLNFEQATGYKDPNALHQTLMKQKTGSLFKQQFDQALQQAEPANAITDLALCAFSADDAGNGDALFALYGDNFLWCNERGWFTYTGTHWKFDADGAEVKKRAVEVLRRRRHAAVECEKEAIVACTKGDERRVNGCVSRFRTLVGISIDAFDNDPDALNCKNGVLDLRTGTLTPHTRNQRFSYCLPVKYAQSYCLEWIDYLNSVVGGGEEVIDYLQMALGYSLTGHTSEEVLFYGYGPTRAGKGTLAEIFQALLPNPIATMVDFNSFTAKREGDVSNFDLAPLKPSRMIFASESNRNQSLNPAKIKQLTGGDLVRACYKHKDFFAYRPQFKVWMLSNWPVNGDPEDDALWGRVRVIEFPNSFLGVEDKSKKARLKEPASLQAILYWAVQGAIKWYARGAAGLPTPKVVQETTQAHRDELDYVQQWLDEVTGEDEVGESNDVDEAWTMNEVVMASYSAWCKNNNVQYPKGPKGLAQSLKAKNYKVGEVKWVLDPTDNKYKSKRGVGGLKIS